MGAALAVASAGTTGAGEAGAEETRAAIDLGGVDTRSAALMLSAQEAGDLEVSVLAIPQPESAADRSRATLVVEVGGASLLAAADQVPARSEMIVEVYAYALDAGGALIDNLTQAFRLDLERDLPLLTTGGVKFFGGLHLAPGAYSLRVLVRERRSDRLGLRMLPLVVPSEARGDPVLPPFRLESPAGWILIHAAGETPEFPVTVGGEPWVPATSADETAIRADPTPLTAPVAAPTERTARQLRGHKAEIGRLEEVRRGYRQALTRLAAGDHAGALDALDALESARIGIGSAEEHEQLVRAELAAAQELSVPDPERMLPVIWLHESLYRRFHQHKNYLLAIHSRRVLSHLADLYLERDRSPRARHLVACALVSVGSYLRETGSLAAAENAYRDALYHDPSHPLALLGVAVIQESYGQYRTAADLLERLHEIQPTDTEARLRLGVNLRRLDKPRQAEDHLRGAIVEAGPAWVGAVAAQELASLETRENRLSEAESVLEEAMARYPEVQRIKLQLAALLDRAGRRAEAFAVLDRLDPSAGSDASSPRLIYTRANTAGIAAVRGTLAEAAERAAAALGFSPEPTDAAVGGRR